jgi:hypothetical protein
MSKKSKQVNREKRLQKKRAMKAANKARYAEMKRVGQNSKSRRSMMQSKKHRLVRMIDHKDGICGNLACIKCYPAFNKVA